MKAHALLAPLGLVLASCSYYTTPAPVVPVAVAPAVVTAPPSTVVLGSGPAQLDSDGDGHADSVDRFPNDATRH